MSNGERPKIYPTDPEDPGDASPYIGRIRGGGDSPWSAAQDPPRTDKRTEPTRREAAGKRPILDRSGRDETNRFTREDTTPKPEFVQPAFFSRSEIFRVRVQTLAVEAVRKAREAGIAERRAMLQAAHISWNTDPPASENTGKPTRRDSSRHTQDQLPID